jgi:uncharacterized protein YecE (DUF72 family)
MTATSPAFIPDLARQALRSLAEAGIFLGTSSWKYPGWLGQLYTADRYLYRGQFAQTRFDRLCLAEYSETFTTVCVDAAYYRFPDDRFLNGLAGQVPDGFRFTFKVTDEITIKRFTRLPRFGDRAGQPNPHFLDAELFASSFLAPLEPFRSKTGVLLFEFSRFYPSDYARGRDFVEALDGFLGKLPKDWRYGVEIRNATFLQPGYFACLARHGVSHVFNSWDAMPSLAEQMALPDAFTSLDHAVARLLLRPGRDYEEAVKRFQPYERIQDPYPEGRAPITELLRRIARRDQGVSRTIYAYVNNRFEGNALQTIASILREMAPA